MLDPQDRVPLYQQLADRIRSRIADGELEAGDRVPSEAELVAEYGVSRITARKSIGLLREEGVVYTRQGQGSFIGPEEARKARRRRGQRYVEIAEDLERRIRDEEWRPEPPLPSEQRFAQHYDVSVSTVRRAIAILRERGMLVTVPGKGTYLACD